MTALAPHLSAYLREHLPRERAVSPHTVKTHLERIFEKLGANDRAQAVAIAIRTGIVH